jgi:hypothetical protein
MNRRTLSIAILLSSAAVAYASGFERGELPKMHKTFDANPARFAHDYIGKPFVSSLIVSNVTKNYGGLYDVALGDKSDVLCVNLGVDDLQGFNKGDTVNFNGTVSEHQAERIIQLEKCAFSRSVPVEDTAPDTAPPAPAGKSTVPHAALTPPASAPTPAVAKEDPKIIYLQPPPPPQVIYVQPPAQVPASPPVTERQGSDNSPASKRFDHSDMRNWRSEQRRYGG